MTERHDPHPADALVGDHGKPDDEADHGHDDGHAGEPLGPIDLPAWGAAIFGAVLGLLVVGAFILAGS